MKNYTSLKIFIFIFTFITNAYFANAYDIIYTSTLTSNISYFDPQGAIIPTGNTVTIAPGAIVQFNFNLTIDSGAVLIVDGATVKMGDGQRIFLVQAQANDTSHHGGILRLLNNSTITSLSSLATGNLWQGIECKGLPGFIYSSGGLLQVDNSTIQLATCAYTNYDPSFPLNGLGMVYAQNARFLNNIRSLELGNTLFTATNNPDSIAWCGNYAENTLFKLTDSFPYAPADMVHGYYAGFVCHSCTFLGASPASYPNPIYNSLNTNGIQAEESMIFVEKSDNPVPPYNDFFSWLHTGISINNPGYWLPVIVSNTSLGCTFDISIDGVGTATPVIIGNNMWGPPTEGATNFPHSGMFFRNCAQYIFEGNLIGYDIDDLDTLIAGVVVMNCGSANNLIYRNQVNHPFNGVGIESIGTNRSSSGSSGLKILCNDIAATKYNIAIMQDTLPNNINGINNLQYVDLGIPGGDLSAGNIFQWYSLPPSNPSHDYYLDNNTNDFTSFYYKYNNATAGEYPTYHNFIDANIINANPNTCPIMNTRSTQPTMPLAPTSLKIPIKLMATFDKDRISERSSNRNQEALQPEEQLQLDRLDNMHDVDQWLSQNKYNWTELSVDKKQQVYDAAENDQMIAGSIARMLLTKYEGKRYDPIILMPKEVGKSIRHLDASAGKIYPNPTTGSIFVNWTGSNATLVLYNITGKKVGQMNIKTGVSEMNIAQLIDGIYLAEIQVNGKAVYQQKIIKQK